MTELRRVADWNRRKLQSPARPQGQRGRTQHSPVDCAELRASRRLQRETASPFVFVSERGSQFTVSGFRRMIERAAMGLEIKVYPTCCGMPVGAQPRALGRKVSDEFTQQIAEFTHIWPAHRAAAPHILLGG